MASRRLVGDGGAAAYYRYQPAAPTNTARPAYNNTMHRRTTINVLMIFFILYIWVYSLHCLINKQIVRRVPHGVTSAVAVLRVALLVCSLGGRGHH